MDASVHSPSPEARDIERALAEPAIAALIAHGAPVFVAAGQPLAIVHANAAALGFFGGVRADALSARLLATPDQGARRLNELASAMRPDAPARLEKLRFTIGRRVESLTCLCRRVGGGSSLLVVGVLGVRAAPVAPAQAATPAAPAEVESDPAAIAAPASAETIKDLAATVAPVSPPAGPTEAGEMAPAHAPPEPARPVETPPPPVRLADPAETEAALMARFQNAPTVRFLWRSDAEGRLAEITGQLCEVVGCDSAALIGRNFAEQAHASGADPTGKLAAALERRETWSGLQLPWPISGAAAAVPVSLGAVPSFNDQRVFDGFRGFGVIHIQRIEPFAPTEPQDKAEAGPAKEAEKPKSTNPEKAEVATEHEKAGTATEHVEPAAREPAPVEPAAPGESPPSPANDTQPALAENDAQATARADASAPPVEQAHAPAAHAAPEPVKVEPTTATPIEPAESEVAAETTPTPVNGETHAETRVDDAPSAIAEHTHSQEKPAAPVHEEIEPATPAEPTPKALWNHVEPEPPAPATAVNPTEPAPAEHPAPAAETPAALATHAPVEETPVANEAEPPASAPDPAPRNVISLRDYRAFPAVLSETSERASTPIDIAGPASPPTNPPSRLVELTPAERKAFGDIARALGAKPIDEDARAKKLGASEAEATSNAETVSTPAGESGMSHAPAADAAGEPTIEASLPAGSKIAETAEPTAEIHAGFDEDEHDPLDHETPAAPVDNIADAPIYDILHVASTEPAAPHDAAPVAAMEHLAPAARGADVQKAATPPESTPEDHAAIGLERNAAKVLDRLPFGVLISRLETPIYLNRALLDLLGYASADLFHEAGSLERMFHGRQAEDLTSAANGGSIPVVSASGDVIPVEGRLQSIEWDGAPATLMSFRKPSDMDLLPHVRSLEAELRQGETQNRELHAILDTATDGVAVLDQNGRILSLNRSAEALFGYEQNEVAGESFTALLAPESHAAAMEYLAGLQANGVASLLNDGREAIGRARQGGLIPIFMTLGRLGATGQKFCAVLRDMTQWKKVERELRDARREAERSSQLKSDFLAKISHEIRTPLNAIIGFAEVIMEERFGPVGNERYKDYLKDIHASGGHVMSLVNDLLDLSKIEAGKLDLNFTAVDANKIVGECVSLIQPQATVDRVIVRTSLAPRLPRIVADERSLRQIMLNILSNAVKFNEPGGQVIVSTALTDSGHAVLRIKDTGIGMNEAEVQTALEPFRQIQTSRAQGGTGLGLPLTKALVEANRASFTIRSKKNEGTLVEVSFPSTRVLAE